MQVIQPSDPSTWQTSVTAFESIEDAWEQICSISHAEDGNLRTHRRNRTTLHLICKHTDCAFAVYVSWDKKKAAHLLRQFNLVHSCTGRGKEAGGTMNTVNFAEAKVSPT